MSMPYDQSSGFDSRDCLIIIDDGPGDTTIRPCPPEHLPFLLAEREKLIRYGVPMPPLPPHIEQMLREQRDTKKPSDGQS